MKMLKMAALVLAVSASTAGAANAQDVGMKAWSASAHIESAQANAPEGATLVQLYRYYNPKEINHYSGREMPQNWQDLGWRQDGTNGFISYTPFAGSRTLYNCFIPGGIDLFTSTDANCEGQGKATWAPITGYIAASQIPGTVPLYRCQRGGIKKINGVWRADHFDTLSSVCENVPNPAMDGVLGYVFL
ncbi:MULTISPECIES: hypothetical protein [Pseudoxanthomonas]|uniref:DUF5648 domain-containing protein n=1 Tax=Pseudoxanthomonas winnipegensis TaxID=2480810 RepID=A0AAW8GB53_9GAMM|nr:MULTISPECIES: hypothetical protein [Pseudoxanthomonas]MDQ1119360.1 hypothetical protein [Pseudoxanthomonas winnipegensis]MDQ1132556.1 hypothetical protein [Pseudoxanthomonas winnipegensis]MDR6137437.1 hypothetical protein [Pseudoxanthomonas sp. SORGH_AS_0997]